MIDPKPKVDKLKVDTAEFKLAETVFIHDIENKVFQSIVLQCLAQIDGISLVEGNFIDHLLGRNSEGLKGIHAEQNEKHQTIDIRVEVNIVYGIPIPEKVEEIQTKISEQITKLTGLHVGSVHIVVRNVVSSEQVSKAIPAVAGQASKSTIEEEYSNEF
jgi:uncharacterized alkaline shock family protein YloU